MNPRVHKCAVCGSERAWWGFAKWWACEAHRVELDARFTAWLKEKKK